MSSPVVKWSDIEAECGPYRTGFVATFHKYEGQTTDEVDKSNRVIKVTQASFARHTGISDQTFRDWVKAEKVVPNTGTTSKAKHSPVVIAAAAAAAALPQTTPPPPLPPAQRKAMKAGMSSTVNAALAPIVRVLHGAIAGCLDDYAEEVQNGIANGTMSTGVLDDIEKAANRLLDVVQAGKLFVP